MSIWSNSTERLNSINIWEGSVPSSLSRLKAMSNTSVDEIFLAERAFNNVPGAYILMFDHEYRLLIAGGEQYSKLNMNLIGRRLNTLSCIFDGYIEHVVRCYENALLGMQESFIYENNDRQYVCSVGTIVSSESVAGVILTSYDVTTALRARKH